MPLSIEEITGKIGLSSLGGKYTSHFRPLANMSWVNMMEARSVIHHRLGEVLDQVAN